MQALLRTNRGHLTAHGDYLRQVQASIVDIEIELADEPDLHFRFGIYCASILIGRVDLLGVEPPRYGLGYFLAAAEQGKGIATLSVCAALNFATRELAATDIFAGVTHGNSRSVRLLERLGFQPAAYFDTYTRYHRSLP